ncbi:hypothetical protein [Alcanivorax sp.]|jgi:pilus assembly protein CpaE|uniref:AAA family ATPase n=1 Tax=Alcanivorax sp. TaxID=1872427 RepID=UPI002582CD06|nr:hypothetical protein [Alcanivorax sp.]
MTEESLLAVVEDEGAYAWLDDALQGSGRIERVSRSDLSRVLRLLEATNSTVALVEVSDVDSSQSMAVITALSNARPWITVMALCRYADQETLLQCMRAGARDCVIVGCEAVELRDRLRRHQLVRPGHVGDELTSRTKNLILVAGVSPRVDTTFLTQNIAATMASCSSQQTTLAIDVVSNSEQIFHLENRGTYDLTQLLASPDTVDHTLIETALEEYRPGLRLLAGGTGVDFLGDQGVDLFIALSRLMGMFDRIMLNVGCEQHSSWIKTIGVHVSDLIVAAHPEVGQLKAVREHIANWRPHLPKDSEVHFVIDGYESAIPPSLDDVNGSTGVEVAAAFPMDWKHRLESINLGVPIRESAPRSAYNRKMNGLVSDLMGGRDPNIKSVQGGWVAKLMHGNKA